MTTGRNLQAIGRVTVGRIQRKNSTTNNVVRESGLSNVEGCKFLTETSWDLEKMEEMLSGYHDIEVIKYLRYGWPINTKNTAVSGEIPRNQSGITENHKKVIEYLAAELRNKSVVGPFRENPFGREARFSPLGTRPKHDRPGEI